MIVVCDGVTYDNGKVTTLRTYEHDIKECYDAIRLRRTSDLHLVRGEN